MKKLLHLIHTHTREITSSIYNFTLVFLLLSFLLVEPLSHVFDLFGKIGTVVWTFLFIFIILETIRGLKTLIVNAAHKKHLLTFFVYFLLIIISVIGTILPINSHFEATQEIVCKLNQFSLSDFGYNTICHLGYPSRQFIIPSIPSVLFGRSLFALNFGSWIYFFCGITIFCVSLLRLYRNGKFADIISSFSILTFTNYYYFNSLLFSYEQAFYPFTFLLMLVGFYLKYFNSRKVKYILLIILINYFLIYNYTTALAVLGLSIFIMMWTIFERRTIMLHRIILTIGIITTGFLLFFSFIIRSDVRITDSSDAFINIHYELMSGMAYFLNGNSLSPFSTTIISSLLFFLVLLSLLTFSFGKKYFFVGIWIIAVITLAIISHGWFLNPIEFRMHRTLIIVPIIIVFAGVILNKILESIHGSKIAVISICLLLLFIGIYNQYTFLRSKIGDERHRHYELINYLKKNIDAGDEIYLYFDNTTNEKFISISDNLGYYFAKSKSEVTSDICYFPANTFTNNSHHTYFLSYFRMPCHGNPHILMHVGSFAFLHDQTLHIFKIRSL